MRETWLVSIAALPFLGAAPYVVAAARGRRGPGPIPALAACAASLAAAIVTIAGNAGATGSGAPEVGFRFLALAELAFRPGLRGDGLGLAFAAFVSGIGVAVTAADAGRRSDRASNLDSKAGPGDAARASSA